MKLLMGMLGVLLICDSVRALPNATDFKEVGEGNQEAILDTERPKASDNEELLSGTVRVIRKIEMTEVFFKDLKDSYYIPSGNKYSSIYKALDESMKKGTQVSFKANAKSRRILSLESTPAKKTTGEVEIKSSLTGGSK